MENLGETKRRCAIKKAKERQKWADIQFSLALATMLTTDV